MAVVLSRCPKCGGPCPYCMPASQWQYNEAQLRTIRRWAVVSGAFFCSSMAILLTLALVTP